jgi:hypothetical protein
VAGHEGSEVSSVSSLRYTPARWSRRADEIYVNWCGHRQEVLPFPLAAGRVTFVPVLGEAC